METIFSDLREKGHRRGATPPLEPIPKWRDNEESFLPNIPREVEDRRLDSIARLITGNTTCAAVAFDGENLLVTNNRNQLNNTAWNFFNFISEVASNPQSLANIKQDKTLGRNMGRFIEEAITEYKTRDGWREKDVEEFERRISRDILKVVYSLATDSIRPLPANIKNALATKNIDFVINNKKAVHAEMTILDALVNSSSSFNTKDPDVNVGKKALYIGITKLCCKNCHDAITAFNNVSRKSNQSKYLEEESRTTSTKAAASEADDNQAIGASIISVTESQENNSSAIHIDARGAHLTQYSWIDPNFFDRCGDVKAEYQMIQESPKSKKAGQSRRQAADDSASSPELSDSDTQNSTVKASEMVLKRSDLDDATRLLNQSEAESEIHIYAGSFTSSSAHHYQAKEFSKPSMATSNDAETSAMDLGVTRIKFSSFSSMNVMEDQAVSSLRHAPSAAIGSGAPFSSVAMDYAAPDQSSTVLEKSNGMIETLTRAAAVSPSSIHAVRLNKNLDHTDQGKRR